MVSCEAAKSRVVQLPSILSQCRNYASQRHAQFGACEECAYSVIHSGYSYTNRSRGLGDDVPPNLRSIFRVEAQRACSAQLNGYGGARQTRSSMIDCRQPWSPRWSPAEAQAPWAVRATRPLASSEAARHRTHRPETSALASGHPPRPRPSYRQIHEPPKPVERLR